MQNHLAEETSPYLLQHAKNPVDWYPWCEEAFAKAESEDKPIFLSVGYSTCHWCHVMAHESFEDEEIGELLNRDYIAIKVDKEERPDIDSVYMMVCQAFTGSGGWPTSIFMTSEQKPFFAGTYFPKTGQYGRPGLKELLIAISEQWKKNRQALIDSAREVIEHLNKEAVSEGEPSMHLVLSGVEIYKRTFDEKYGGFGDAPKFPTPHNLLFLLEYYAQSMDKVGLKMVEQTLMQMYRGGINDHIGGGFCRYSTDKYFLAPHFEKMLYDNALLILAYCKAYQITGKDIYRMVARQTGDYVLREMTSPAGGYYSAQDADSEGIEGKYYLLEPEEVIAVLGEETGNRFNAYYNITSEGNFEGKSIPNRLKDREDIASSGKITGDVEVAEAIDIAELDKWSEARDKIYQYRKERYFLHLDDKILTSWNGLMIAAMCALYEVAKEAVYLDAAKKAQQFIQEKLCDGEKVYTSYRRGKHSKYGFLDDYANQIFGLLSLYEVNGEETYIKRAEELCQVTLREFHDEKSGGFFFYGEQNERLILHPKETYDGAMFSGNSGMAYNLMKLYELTKKKEYEDKMVQQMKFMSGAAGHYPAGYGMFLLALLKYLDMPIEIAYA